MVRFDRRFDRRFVQACSVIALVQAGTYCVIGGVFGSLFLFLDQAVAGALILTGAGAFFAAIYLDERIERSGK